MTDDASTYPADTSLAEVIAGFEQRGFTGHFDVDESTGSTTCVACGAASSPSEIEVADSRRVEGASDPSEMTSVLAVRCPSCGQTGTISCRYGPEASAGEADLLRAAKGTHRG